LTRQLRHTRVPVEVLLLLRSVYLPLTLPYVSYIDGTVELSRQHWPPSAPWRGRTLKEVLECERAFFGSAAHIFTTGHLVSHSLGYHYGIPSDRVTVVGAGSNFAPSCSARRTQREPWILFVGYDFARKGGNDLLQAFREVRRRHPFARLKIVGPRLNLDEPGVEVVGPVLDRQRLGDLYAKSLVFALPARYEPYGLSFLEAMAHGVACVGTQVGAVSEIIKADRTGHLVGPGNVPELADVLSSLVGDPDRAVALGDAGLRRVREEFTWDRVAERMAPVLANVQGRGH